MAERPLRREIIVPADLETVWSLWTTPAGIVSFLAPSVRVVLRPGGLFELGQTPDTPARDRRPGGTRLLSLQHYRFLSFTWYHPQRLWTLRGHATVVIIRFEPLDEYSTLVEITHTGWGEDDDWDRAREDAERFWQATAHRLLFLFRVGPVRWTRPQLPAPAHVPPPDPEPEPEPEAPVETDALVNTVAPVDAGAPEHVDAPVDVDEPEVVAAAVNVGAPVDVGAPENANAPANVAAPEPVHAHEPEPVHDPVSSRQSAVTISS